MPFSSMDGALIAQTLPSRPMTTHHALELEVSLDDGLLLDAAAHLAGECAALRSVVVETRSRFLCRTQPFTSARAHRQVHLAAERQELSETGWLDAPFELASEWPFRVRRGITAAGRTELVFTLHHSVTDGRGALMLFDWYLRTVLALRGGKRLPDSPVRQRHPPSLRALVQREGLPFAAKLSVNVARGAGRFRQQRATLFDSPEAAPERFGLIVEEIPTATWRALRAAARDLGCTRNDLLWCAALEAADRFRLERGLPEEVFRLVGGVDLRNFYGAPDALQNWVGTLEADFTPDEVRDSALPARVHERLARARVPEHALVTPLLLGMLGRLLRPRAYRELFRRMDLEGPPSLYTLLLSHIRPPRRLCWPAELSPRKLWCASTLPRKPGLGLTVTSGEDHVTLAMCWPIPLSRPDSMRAFLRDTLEVLQRFAVPTEGRLRGPA